jgi:O-antigen ligase
LALITGQLAWYRAASPAPLGAQVAGLALFYLSAGLFLVVAHQVRDVRWLQWIVGLFLLLGALNVLGWLLPGIVGRLTGRLFSSGATGSLFWTWLLILAFTQALFNTELRPPLRLAAGGLAVATTYVILTEFWTWNSGWMPPLAAVFTILFFAFPRLGVLMTVAATVPVLIKIQAVIASLMVGDNQYSYETRLEAWAIVWELAQANPILGLGPANYYWYTPLIPIRGYSVQFNSHQQYVDLIAQTGILGLICFVGFFAAMGWLAWRLRPQMPPGFARAYTYAVLGGVGGTFVAGWLPGQHVELALFRRSPGSPADLSGLHSGTV